MHLHINASDGNKIFILDSERMLEMLDIEWCINSIAVDHLIGTEVEKVYCKTQKLQRNDVE